MKRRGGRHCRELPAAGTGITLRGEGQEGTPPAEQNPVSAFAFSAGSSISKSS